MIEDILTGLCGSIGTIYVLWLLFWDKGRWEFIIGSIVAFCMIIGVLLMGKFVFGVW